MIEENRAGKGRLQHKIGNISLKSWYLVKDSKAVEEVKHKSLGSKFQAERTANTKTLKLESIWCILKVKRRLP